MCVFGSIVTAMVTPFNEELEIDYPKVKELIEHLISTGSNSVVVCGTTGESPTLSHQEKVELIKYVVESVNGRINVIAGAGTNCTKESVEFTKEVEQLGVNGIMAVVPYYNKPNQEGLYRHFKLIAENTKLPVMLYNIPARTGVNLELSTIQRLATVPNITSIKDATGIIEEMVRVIEKTPEDFHVYSGDDNLTFPAVLKGAAGVVSVASHIIGKEMSEMISATKNEDKNKAYIIHDKYEKFMKSLFLAPNPVPVKYALNKIGISVGGVRLPLVELTREEEERLEAAMKEVNVI